MANPPPLQYDTYYHIFNRGTNGENLFIEDGNYVFFLKRYATYIQPVAFTYAYCLMKNHFHFLVRTKTPEEQLETITPGGRQPAGVRALLEPSRQFGRLFNSYAKAFNRRYGRTGSLFEHPFERMEITTESHLQCLVACIHRNPQHHGFVSDSRAWPYSSYAELASQRPTHLVRDTVLDWFGDLEGFLESHTSGVNEHELPSIVGLGEPKGLGDL